MDDLTSATIGKDDLKAGRAKLNASGMISSHETEGERGGALNWSSWFFRSMRLGCQVHNESKGFLAYRWRVLGLACLLAICMVWSWFIIPSLAHLLFSALNLTQAQFTLIFTAPFLIGIFASIPGGALGDRLGIHPVVTVATLLMGVAGAARAGAPSAEAMFALMCLWGIGYAVVMPNLPKLVGVWFSPRETGMASGIYACALTVGASLGLFTGPLFAGLKTAFLTIGTLTMIAAVLWALGARSTPTGVMIKVPPMRVGVERGMRSRNVWLIAVGMCLSMGAFGGLLGNLPVAFGKLYKVEPETAGALSSVCTWGMAFGNLVLPRLSDKLGRRKVFVSTGAVVSAGCFFAAWYFAPGTGTWILILVSGLLFGSIQPLLFAILAELPEIGPECLGGASGLVATFLNAGGFFLPLMVVSPLLATGTLGAYTRGFFVTALLTAAVCLPMLFVVETRKTATS